MLDNNGDSIPPCGVSFVLTIKITPKVVIKNKFFGVKYLDTLSFLVKYLTYS